MKMNVSDTEKIKEAESNILIAIGYLTRDGIYFI